MLTRTLTLLLFVALLLPMESALCQYEQETPQLVWHETADEAIALAKSEQKPLLVFIYMPSSKTCKKFDKHVLQSKKFMKAAAAYVLLKVKVKEDKKFTAHYADIKTKNGIPYLLLLSADGKLLYKSSGAKKAGEIAKVMRQHAGEGEGLGDKECESCDKDDCTDCDKK